ncbi:MAG: leucine-rich repeat domain-containing protein [Treponema sp.]|jgi:hypothetical protein|nr:leucine-rich repeat domain-containing protein [Treponema sp.]
MKKSAVFLLCFLALAGTVFADSAPSGMQFSLNAANDGVVITKYNGTSLKLLVPGDIEGFPVTEIGANAFAGGTINEITLPPTLKIIGEGAFSKSRLTKIAIPEGVTRIEKSAFEGCFNLTGVVLPSSLTSIGDSAFASSSLVAVVLPAHVSEIGAKAFAGCTRLASVTLGAYIGSIGVEAFARCGSLKTLAIPDAVKRIAFGADAFTGCKGLILATQAKLKTLGYSGGF